MDFEELYGAPEPADAIKTEEQQSQAQAPATGAAADGDDLFLQLYGEAAPEIAAEAQAQGDKIAVIC